MSLAYYMRSKGVNVRGFSSRRNNTEDFEHLSCEELVRESGIIFVTVTDSAIPIVWDKIRRMDLSDKIICHCSGALSSEIFKGADRDMVCSVHPMLAFNSVHTPLGAAAEAFFTVEGGKTAADAVSEILSLCENKFRIITSENKVKYHAAACFASNFVVAVCYKAQKLLEECGFSEEEARESLRALMLRNMENIVNDGCEKAITGPAARGDTRTVENHMKELKGKDKELYRLLTDVILDMKEKSNEVHNSGF